VAVIKVGAATEVEQKEKQHRVEDAVEATKAALEQGIVTGGGIALLNESVKLSGDLQKNLAHEDRIATQILVDALSAPIKQIVANAGQSPDVVIAHVQELQSTYLKKTQKGKKIDIETGSEIEVDYHMSELNPKANFNIGYNAEENAYTDMFQAGIIDPTKVVVSALSNAVSAAAMLLTTEAVVTDVPEKKEKGAGMPDMSGMNMGGMM
jgi:chaperonin GroEL